MVNRATKLLFSLVLIILCSCSDQENQFGGYDDPRFFEGVGLDKNPLGENISNEIKSNDIRERFFSNSLPKIFILGYYDCPQMCNSFRESLFPELNRGNLILGSDYEIVMLSIDPEEREALSQKEENKYFDLFFEETDLSRKHFNFIVDPASIDLVTNKLGFSYKKYKRNDEDRDYYNHPAVAYLLLANGTVSNIIEYGEKVTSIEDKINLASNGVVINEKGAELPPSFQCLDTDTENKNPKNAFALAQFTGIWFVSCVGFSFVHLFLSRREKRKKK